MKKKLFMFSLIALALMMSIMGVSAVTIANGVVIVQPTASSYSQNLTLQVMNVTTLFGEMKNCTFYVKSATLTANSSWVNMGTFLNTTLNAVNGTYNSTYLEDGTDYTLNATCRNSSNDIAYATVLLTIDNTVPTAPTSLSPSDSTSLNSAATDYSFSATVTNSKTTSCTYVIGRGGTSTSSQDTTSATGTYSGSNCSFTKTFADHNSNGEWYYYFTASDGTNTTSSGSNKLQVGINPTGGYNPDEETIAPIAPKSTVVTTITNVLKNNGFILFIIVVVIVIIAAVIGSRIKK